MISKMRYNLSIWIFLIVCTELNNGQEVKNTNTTMTRRRGNSTNGVEPKNMISRCQPNSDEYCYLTEAIEFILFGEPEDPTVTDQFLDTLLDNGTLDSVLQFGIAQLHLFAQDNPQLIPGDFNFILQDLKRMAALLALNGSQAITGYDLKYYIKRFINRHTAMEFLRFYLRNVPRNAKSYINDIYLNDIQTESCRQALSLWFDAMENPLENIWALRMLDASGKPPTNILGANTNWLGSWDGCRRVEYTNQSFQFNGRYCRAKIYADPSWFTLPDSVTEGFPGDSSELAAIDLGLCVPDICSPEDIASVLNNTLRLLTIHQLTYIRREDGVQCEGPVKPNGAFYFTIALIAILTTIVVLATLYDCLFRTILNKPYATASALSLKDMYTFCNLSSAREQSHRVFYPDLNACQYQFSNRLRLHGMKYPSVADRNAVLKKRKVWTDQTVCQFHNVAIELSAYTALLKPMASSSAIKCLNGIRVLSMIWIILGHTFNYFGEQNYFLLVQNALDVLDFSKERVSGQIIINTLYAVDTFFLVSAMLVTLSMTHMLQKNGMPRWYFWPMMYLERYLRLIPPYILIFLIYTFVLPYIVHGPLWSTKTFPVQNELCHDYWWAYFLLINNFIANGKGTQCLGYYWYVANDFQLFVIAPLLILPLYYYPLIGSFILFGMLAASSVLLGFNMANTYRIGQVLVTLQEIWKDTYTKPYCRAGPYIIGIALGYLFFKTERKKVHLNPFAHLILWVLTIVFLCTSIFGNWTNHAKDAQPMSPAVYVTYFVLSHITWPLGIAWIIFSCYKGLAPIVNSILSWHGFTFYAHISYTTYLIHPMIIVTYLFSQQNVFHATTVTVIYLFFGHLIISLIAGFIAHIILERPFAVLFKLLLPKRAGYVNAKK